MKAIIAINGAEITMEATPEEIAALVSAADGMDMDMQKLMTDISARLESELATLSDHPYK